jgi:hypothetical protein
LETLDWPITDELPLRAAAAVFTGEDTQCPFVYALLNVTVAIVPDAVGEVPVVRIRSKDSSVALPREIVGDVPEPLPAMTVGAVPPPLRC